MTTDGIRRSFQLLISAGLLAASGGFCLVLIKTQPKPSRLADVSRWTEVEAIAVEPCREALPVVGHGTVRPRNQVEIVPLVSGRLTQAHANLAQGKVISKGELLFEIDPTLYESRVQQAEAENRQLEALLKRYDQELENLKDRIENAEHVLAIDEADLETTQRLFTEEKVGTQRGLDLVRVKLLRQQDALSELTSRRSMIPFHKTDVQAKLDAAEARLKQANYNLANTKIHCPFDARVEAVHARASQVVTAHLAIATLTDREAFELSVGIDPRELRWLQHAIRPVALKETGGDGGPVVKVRWSLHGQQFTWNGRVTRFERVNERTRTAQLVVEVRKEDMIPVVEHGGTETGPELAIGMFCSAELPAEPLVQALLVPRHAIYDNRWVYVVEPDFDGAPTGKLARRRVPILRTIRDSVLVDYAQREGTETCELKPHEQLVVSRLVKPVVGMEVRLRGSDPVDPAVAGLDLPDRGLGLQDSTPPQRRALIRSVPVIAQVGGPSGGR